MADIKKRIYDDMQQAMRDKSPTLATLRLMWSSVRQREIDSRPQIGDAGLDDTGVVAVLSSMVKQRKDSITQYEAASRPDLASKEQEEIVVIQHYLPQAMSDEEVAALVRAALEEVSAKSIADMGKVMAIVKPKLQGRADMGQVSNLVRAALTPS